MPWSDYCRIDAAERISEEGVSVLAAIGNGEKGGNGQGRRFPKLGITKISDFNSSQSKEAFCNGLNEFTPLQEAICNDLTRFISFTTGQISGQM